LAFHAKREADYSPPSSAEVKERVELYLHSPNTPSWRGAQLGGAQGQVTRPVETLVAKFSRYIESKTKRSGSFARQIIFLPS
jgi:hypothetical protein